MTIRLSRFWPASLGLIVLALALPGLAQVAPPEFVAHTVEGTSHRGTLERLGDGWSLRLGGSTPRDLEAGELLSLRRTDRLPPPWPLDEHAVLTNGDQVRGTVLGMMGERILFRLPAELGVAKEVRLPLAALSLLWFTAPEDQENPGRLLRQLATGERSRDTVLLRNGDRVEGILSGIDPQSGVTLEVNRREVKVDRNKVAAIALTTDLGDARKVRGTRARLVLADGSRLTLTAAACDGTTLTATTSFGVEVRLALTSVIALDITSARTVYLSDLKPKRYDFTPALDIRWPFVSDGSVEGDMMRLGGGTYDRGLGMHSASRLTYELRGEYRRFEALVGLDDRTGQLGSVRVAVLVDGKPRDLGNPGELTVRTGPIPVRVDVRNARELTLVVEFGHRLGVQDHVNWAEARLIR